jgi:hypothetical protein
MYHVCTVPPAAGNTLEPSAGILIPLFSSYTGPLAIAIVNSYFDGYILIYLIVRRCDPGSAILALFGRLIAEKDVEPIEGRRRDEAERHVLGWVYGA